LPASACRLPPAPPLKVGVSAGPYADILRYASDLAKKDGIDAQIIEFTDWTLPNEALNAGDLDLNNFQHQPYLDNQVRRAATTSFRSPRASSCRSASIRRR